MTIPATRPATGMQRDRRRQSIHTASLGGVLLAMLILFGLAGGLGALLAALMGGH